MAITSINISSLYSSGQCLLSVLGSIGVILLFAGIPQLIYAPQVNPGSLMTFLLGALLISLMVAGNAFIGYKYKKLIRQRREEQIPQPQQHVIAPPLEDKPPSYDDLLEADGLPPAYTTIIKGKPPRYEETITEVFNWPAIARMSSMYNCHPHESPSADIASSFAAPPSHLREAPLTLPFQKYLKDNFKPNKTLFQHANGELPSPPDQIAPSSSSKHNPKDLSIPCSASQSNQSNISQALHCRKGPSWPKGRVGREAPGRGESPATVNRQSSLPVIHSGSSSVQVDSSEEGDRSTSGY